MLKRTLVMSWCNIHKGWKILKNCHSSYITKCVKCYRNQLSTDCLTRFLMLQLFACIGKSQFKWHLLYIYMYLSNTWQICAVTGLVFQGSQFKTSWWILTKLVGEESEMIRFWWPWPSFQGHFYINGYVLVTGFVFVTLNFIFQTPSEGEYMYYVFF